MFDAGSAIRALLRRSESGWLSPWSRRLWAQVKSERLSSKLYQFTSDPPRLLWWLAVVLLVVTLGAELVVEYHALRSGEPRSLVTRGSYIHKHNNLVEPVLQQEEIDANREVSNRKAAK